MLIINPIKPFNLRILVKSKEENLMTQPEKHRHGVLYRALFLDELSDHRTRPVLIYATIVIALGTIFYHWLEGWDWVDSLYFVVITLTTIGYGDLTPTTTLTKFITVFYGINGVMLLLMLFDVVRTLRGWEVGAQPKESES
jgi:hypothetical protein